ncbi:MAG: hypothetical protein WA988_13820 [Candidatus Nanopelagicales bacterium]
MSTSKRRTIILRLFALVGVALIAAYTYYGVIYRNPNWILSPPNVLHYDGRTYQPSNFDLMNSPPDRPQYDYAVVARLHPFGQEILGYEDVPIQTSLYLEWRGKYHAYSLLGGP